MVLGVKESEFGLVWSEGSECDLEEEGFGVRRGDGVWEESKVSMGERFREQRNRNGGDTEADRYYVFYIIFWSLFASGIWVVWIGWL